jgi:hypothetical protein
MMYACIYRLFPAVFENGQKLTCFLAQEVHNVQHEQKLILELLQQLELHILQ